MASEACAAAGSEAALHNANRELQQRPDVDRAEGVAALDRLHVEEDDRLRRGELDEVRVEVVDRRAGGGAAQQLRDAGLLASCSGQVQ